MSSDVGWSGVQQLALLVLCCSPSRCAGGCGCGSAAQWVADSEDVVLLHEPGRYPVAYFPLDDVARALSYPRRTARRSTATSAPTAWFTRARR